VTATAQADAIWVLANQLLDCAAGELDLTEVGAPERRCVVYGGQLVWDDCDCGLLAVHVPRIYLSATFPNPLFAPTPCDVPFTVAEYVVTILRCVPQPDHQGNPPPCSEITPAAKRDFLDRSAVMRGVQCCLADMRMTAVGDQLAIGEAGTCAGSELHVFAASVNCVEC
jgi:hypothetical protein